MTWYPDLSPYTYMQDAFRRNGREFISPPQIILNVGWLAPGHDFPVGDSPAGLVDALAELRAEHAQARTRGWHQCDFCDRTDIQSLFSDNSDESRSRIGSAEIRVVSKNGITLAAPTLVAHYVERHRYLPPAEFVEAVLARRVAPELDR